MSIAYRPRAPEDTPHIGGFWRQRWGDEYIVAHGRTFRPEDVEGFVAVQEGQWVGLATCALQETGCEIVSLDSLQEGCGIGSRLLAEIAAAASRAGCRRLFLTTTNDNLRALGFYQKRGFVLSALRPGALARARQLKPAIPLTGMNGIPLRDEIELERSLP